MNSNAVSIKRVKVTRDHLVLRLSDGATWKFSLDLYPSLKGASWPRRRYTRLIGDGVGIHWPWLDYDLSLEGIFNGKPEFIPTSRATVEAPDPGVKV